MCNILLIPFIHLRKYKECFLEIYSSVTKKKVENKKNKPDNIQ